MIYRLSPGICLRGWQGASCGILDRTAFNRVSFVNQDRFGVLLLCDGQTELDDDMLTADQKQILDKCIEEKLVTPCAAPNPIAEEQEYVLYENRYIRSVLWSVTGRCNFKCKHCYMDAPTGKLGEISREEALSIIDQLAECGVQTVELTGGEPLVRRDIWELIDRLVGYGIYIDQIYTNGWLLDETVLDELEKRGLHPEFSISFDGLGWHDWMRGVPGAEEKVLKVLELCKSRGFATNIEMSIHRDSVASLRESVKVLSKYVSRIKIGNIMSTDLWKQYGEDRGFVGVEYYEEMIKYIPQFYEDGMPGNVTLGNVIRMQKDSSEFRINLEKHDDLDETSCQQRYLCGAARMAAYITPEGRLLPCMPMTSWEKHTQFPLIREIGLQKGLSDSLFMNFVNGRVKELFEKNSECASCAYRVRCCGGCRAKALENGDDLFGCDRDMCLLWKGGYVERFRKAAEEAVAKYCRTEE